MRYFKKSNVIVILLNLLSLGAFGFLGRQLYHDASQVIATYQELHATTHGKENLAVINKTLAETAESRAVVAGAFLRSNDLIAFIEQLEGLARVAGVILNLDEPKPIMEKGKTAHLDLDFQATGSFAGLYRFLSLLENLPYRLEWRSATLAFANGTTWSGDFSLSIISYTNTK